MRVLIVDDCDLSAGMLAVVLEVYGHQVRLTRSTKPAVRAAAEFHPDMVLLTVTAPVGSTEIDAIWQFRAIADNEPQIFALCATPEALSNRERLIFDHVFPRPVRFGQLKPFLDAPVAEQQALGQAVRSA